VALRATAHLTTGSNRRPSTHTKDDQTSVMIPRASLKMPFERLEPMNIMRWASTTQL
jgi:hypothetical protein